VKLDPSRDRRGLRDRLALTVDLVIALAPRAESDIVCIPDCTRSGELHGAELIERDEATADAGASWTHSADEFDEAYWTVTL